jgi:hypothetical protein
MKTYKGYGRKAKLLLDRIPANGEKMHVRRGSEDMFMETENPNMVGK